MLVPSMVTPVLARFRAVIFSFFCRKVTIYVPAYTSRLLVVRRAAARRSQATPRGAAAHSGARERGRAQHDRAFDRAPTVFSRPAIRAHDCATPPLSVRGA
jgi:hypothetical protein